MKSFSVYIKTKNTLVKRSQIILVLLEYKNTMELWHTINKYEGIEQKYVDVVLKTFLK